jgi:AcrR family transcriptional regulator
LAGEALSAREAEVGVEPAQRKLSPGPGRLRKEVVAHQLTRIHRALIDIVAEQGYKALKVRDVVRRAEVSTRAFYELFDSKEDCFRYSYDRLIARATRRMLAAQVGEPDWRRRASLIVDEFAGQVEQDPKGARLALVDVHRAGPACSVHAEGTERAFEALLGECLARAPRGVSIPRLIVEGIAAGVAGVARDFLVSGRPGALRDCREDLVQWALCYADSSEVELAALDRGSVWRATTLEPPSVSPAHAQGLRRGDGDRALILKRTAELAVKRGYSGLTVERIRTEANVSRREFQAHFDGVADCYTAAFEQRTGEVMAQAARAQAAARSRGGGIYKAIAVYWAHVSGDPFLAQAFLANDFPAGAAGARSRKRMTKAIADQLLDAVLYANRPGGLEQDASLHAVSTLFRRYLPRNGSPQRNLSATLAYLLLVPAVGSRGALSEIAGEQ